MVALAPPWRGDHGVVPVGGYLAAALVVLGGSILVGDLFRPVSAFLRWPLRSRRRGAGPMRLYAASHLQRPAGRHRLTAAGLAVAIGMAAAMGILVASFERTLTSWIEQLLKADMYVAAAGTSSVANENIIPAETWQAIAATPGVAGLDLLRRYRLTVEGRDFFLGGSQQHDDPSRHLRLIWKAAPADEGPLALATLWEGRVPAWVSDSFARQFDCGRGDDFLVPTPSGPQTVRIAGVYAEYGGEIGTMMVGRNFTRKWFHDDAANQLAIYAEASDDPSAIDNLEARIIATFPHLVVRSNARLREESLRIFHQTFAVTYALEAIAVFIAVAGLGLALAGLLLERKEELATLREMGVSRREIAAAAVWEGLGLVLVGVSGGMAMSFLLGAILIYVINPQCFGWTLGYTVPWWSFLALAGITALTAAAVAAAVGSRFAMLRSDRTE
jgi:putative ABC transport system permease protein